MKRQLLFFYFLCSVATTYGQPHNVDSLINVLESQTLTPTEQLNCYQELFAAFIQNDWNKAAVYAEKGLNLAKKEKNDLMLSVFNQKTSDIYKLKNSYDTAFVYLNKSLDFAIRAKSKDQEASVYANFGNIYAQQTDHQLALEYYAKALSILEEKEKGKLYGEVLVSIGSLYYRIGNFSQATKTLEKALEIEDELYKPQIYYQLGLIASGNGEIEKALEYQQAIIDISQDTNNKVFEIAGNDAMSVTYLYDIKDYDTALNYAERCLTLAEEYGDPMILAGIWKLLSNVYRHQRDYRLCQETALKSWAIDSTDLDIGTNLAYNIAFSSAFLGDQDKAEYFLWKYSALSNKKSDRAYQDALVEVEVKYETEKKEMTIVSLEKEKNLYTWLGIAGSLLTIALGGILWLNIRNSRKEKQLIASRSIMDGEMKERSRLASDLHDRLSGNLSAIKIEFNSIAQPIQSLSDKLDICIKELRRVAHNLMPASLQYGMKTALEDFSAQFPNVQFHFFGEESRFDERAEYVIYCCANELVTNSLRHAEAENIYIQLVQEDKYVTLTVQDDGKGYDEKSIKEGMGLKSIRDRVRSCNGKIDVFSSHNKGTETIIELKV